MLSLHISTYSPRRLLFQSVMMFSKSIQSALISLYSSTGSDPLYLWSSHVDATLSSDSFITHLNDSTSLPTPLPPQTLISPPSLNPPSTADPQTEQRPGHELDQMVLHVQSPTLRKTYIRCPPEGWTMSQATAGRSTDGKLGRQGDLGLKHPWMFVQVRNLAREWSFEVGLVDQGGKEGIVRCSTFQVRLSINETSVGHAHATFKPKNGYRNKGTLTCT